MRNRFMIYRKGHSVASALLFVLLIAHLLLPLLAWLGSAAGFPLGNLFSSEGIRWYYLHSGLLPFSVHGCSLSRGFGIWSDRAFRFV